jgi:hypothetical protein
MTARQHADEVWNKEGVGNTERNYGSTRKRRSQHSVSRSGGSELTVGRSGIKCLPTLLKAKTLQFESLNTPLRRSKKMRSQMCGDLREFNSGHGYVLRSVNE